MAGYCTSCGAPLEDGTRFCTSCGAPVGQTRPAPRAGGAMIVGPLIGALAGAAVAVAICAFVLPGFLGARSGAVAEEVAPQAEVAAEPTQQAAPEQPAETPQAAETAPAPEPAPEPEPAPSMGTYVLPDSATRDYSREELESLSNWELYLARNELYARHGRQFRNQDLRDWFGAQPWYAGTIAPDDFDEGILNAHEVHNRDLIKEIETERGSSYLN